MPPASPDPANESSGAARLDRWLWALRVYKTRPLATEDCRRGAVDIGGVTAKPARPLHAGDVVTVRQEGMTRTLQVIAVPKSRIGAKLVKEFCTDLTPPAEFERLRERGLQRVLMRDKGSGRPTKKERRIIDRLFE